MSNDNAYPEAFFRTTKYRLDFPKKGFASLEAARVWCSQFVHWYNEVHKHSSLNFVTPSQRHRGEDSSLLEKRHDLYVDAKSKFLRRWSGDTRNWTRQETVTLNPDKKLEKMNIAA